jgi:uncharacterized protein YcbK (DUF882 family)|tara:strand:- start:191 stop:577 length:387 start_codon:yes stop_codon:yes gene_type:complete
MKLTNNFNKSEFECNCGCEMPNEVFLQIQKLASQLQCIRDFIRFPIKITSAYRCPSHNKEVGGVSNSQHVLGKASDIQVSDSSPEAIYQVIDTLAEYGHVLQGGLGLYNTFTHYDIRKTRARWDKTKE